MDFPTSEAEVGSYFPHKVMRHFCCAGALLRYFFLRLQSVARRPVADSLLAACPSARVKSRPATFPRQNTLTFPRAVGA